LESDNGKTNWAEQLGKAAAAGIGAAMAGRRQSTRRMTKISGTKEMGKLRSDGECHCGRDLDRGEAVSLHHVIDWDRVSFRVSLLVVDEWAAASLGVPHIATCPDLMPSVQLNRRDLGARGKQSGHDAMQIRRMKDPGNQQNIDTSLSRMIGHRAYIRVHHCFRPLIDPPRPMEPEGVNVDPLNEIRASLGKLHQAPGGRGLANTRGSAQKHYAHRPRLHGSNDRDHQLNGAGVVDERHRLSNSLSTCTRAGRGGVGLEHSQGMRHR
jgi:hypothetical protein